MDKLLLSKKIRELFIVRENDGTYNLFGKYIVIPERGTFKVLVAEDDVLLHFSTLRNAVTWCVFERNNKKKELNRVYELDQLIGSLDVTIAQNTKLMNKLTDSMDKYIYSAKLVEAKHRKKQALKEIEDYANLSRYLQNKKYTENMDKK